MSTKSPFRVMTGSGPSEVRPREDARRTVHQLKALAVSGLERMFDPERQLFCWRLNRTDRGLVREGISRRYTLIALLGLHQLEASGTVSPIAVRPVLDGLLSDTDWIDNLGDLGLLLWLCSLEDPQWLTEGEYRLEIENAIYRFRDGRQNKTMELAWFLAGLSHMGLASPERWFDLRDAAVETYRRLRTNQGDSGIFGHIGTAGSIAGRFRGRIGSFADQVYPIYAIAKFVQAYHVAKATESALDCALTLCQAQGPQGQWWWHYDSLNGRVLETYPVYSVHQDGMAPLALFALGDVTHSDFGPWIYKGLEWISGNNELDYDMPDPSARVIWRSMLRRSSKRYWNTAIAFLTKREDRATRNGLEILFECRPYHLGWLLYAFADRDAQLP
jgi:hypothetical protein